MSHHPRHLARTVLYLFSSKCYLLLPMISGEGYSKIIPIKIMRYKASFFWKTPPPPPIRNPFFNLSSNIRSSSKPFLNPPPCISAPEEHSLVPICFQGCDHRLSNSVFPKWSAPGECLPLHAWGGRQVLQSLFWRKTKNKKQQIKRQKRNEVQLLFNTLFDLGISPYCLPWQWGVGGAIHGAPEKKRMSWYCRNISVPLPDWSPGRLCGLAERTFALHFLG